MTEPKPYTGGKTCYASDLPIDDQISIAADEIEAVAGGLTSIQKCRVTIALCQLTKGVLASLTQPKQANTKTDER